MNGKVEVSRELREETIMWGAHKEGIFELNLEEWGVFPDMEETLGDLIKSVEVWEETAQGPQNGM